MEQTTQRRAVIYCRVSTKEQAEEGNSLVTQERNCREYAQKYNYEISQVFIEEGESAKTADRTELQKLLRFCSDRKQKITAVIIYKIDRLSRNTDDYSQLRILLKRYGVEIKSTSEYFENTPAGRFMENIIANVAQFDNDVRTERSVGGMRNAVFEGRYVWVAPVGYINQKVEGKATIVQSDQAPIVKKGFELMAEKRYSVEAIRDTLLSLGLTSRYGKPISKSGFYTMLKNELYTGWIYKFGEKHKGKFEPIVTEELFTRVQQVMRNKKTPLIYKLENPDFPLRRFISHSQNHNLTGAWSKGRNKHYGYYRFIGTQLYWPKEYLESLFYSFMDQYAFNEGLLIKLKKEMKAYFSDNSNVKEKEVASLIVAKQQLKGKQNTLLQKNIQGIISDVLLKDQLLSLEEEIWNIDKILLQKDERKVDVKEILKYISDFLLQPSMIWRNAPLHIKLKLQWFQFPEGVMFDGKEFRTTKISSVFKLKQFFSDHMSCNVPLTGMNYEHEYITNSPPKQDKKHIPWNDIKEELLVLQEVLASKAPGPPE
jgi:site-specific DNA recombinase